MGMDLAFEISGDRSRTRVVLPASALVHPVTVGTAGQLRIKAPSVLAEHAVFMFRDGRLRGASASVDNPVFVDGRPVPAAWTDLPLPCSMQIGSVRVDVHPAAPVAARSSGGRMVTAPPPPPPPPARTSRNIPAKTPVSGVHAAPALPPVLPIPRPGASVLPPPVPSHHAPMPPSMPTRVQSIDELVQRRAAAQREGVAEESLGGVERAASLELTAARDPKRLALGVLSRLREDWRRTSIRIKVAGAVLPALAVFVLSSPSGAQVQGEKTVQMVAGEGIEAPGATSPSFEGVPTPSALALQGAPGTLAPTGASLGVAPVPPGPSAPATLGQAPTSAPQYVVTQPAQGPMPQVFVPNAGLPPPVSIEEATLRRQAIDALFAGDYPRAMALYQSLAGGRPDVPQYAATAKVLAGKTRGH